ncbi:hypothetical protein EYF80_037712 [Liparis tanakae]|uniref:Uncharacterized protein n=1 Tax=Liparis tanakae TaxID=230148 RepID=A0A4Z2GH73_9TELE|nr:hypothetical protein EYF80_037712 [Liparis tanakae]
MPWPTLIQLSSTTRVTKQEILHKVRFIFIIIPCLCEALGNHEPLNERCFDTKRMCALVSAPEWSDWTGREVLSDGSRGQRPLLGPLPLRTDTESINSYLNHFRFQHRPRNKPQTSKEQGVLFDIELAAGGEPDHISSPVVPSAE